MKNEQNIKENTGIESDELLEENDEHTLKKLWCSIGWTPTKSVQFVARCKFIAKAKIRNFYVHFAIKK